MKILCTQRKLYRSVHHLCSLLQNELQTKFDRNEQIDFEEFLEITGLMYWVAQFYNRPNLTCSPAYEVLRQAREQATDKISITEDLMRNINSLQEDIRQRTNLMSTDHTGCQIPHV